MNWNALTRLKEPSTWVAFGSLLMALGIGTGIDENTWAQIGTGIGALCAAIGAVVKDPGSET